MTREPEDTATEINQNEIQKGKEIKKKKERTINKLWLNMKLHLLYIREGKRREVWAQEGSWDLDVIGST